MGLHTAGCCGWNFVATPAAESAEAAAAAAAGLGQPWSQRPELLLQGEPALWQNCWDFPMMRME